jgi:hypothetical protein
MGERKRAEERIGRKSTYFSRISLCIPATDPAKSGFRPNLSNPRTYTVVRYCRPVPVDRPDFVARLQLPVGERKKSKRERALRERWLLF